MRIFTIQEQKLIIIEKIYAMIRPNTPRRGAHRTMSILKEIKDKYSKSIEIHIFGCDDITLEKENLETDFEFKNHEILKRIEVAELAGKSDIFIDLSDYQAFGRTGLEAMASGCISILPTEGG